MKRYAVLGFLLFSIFYYRADAHAAPVILYGEVRESHGQPVANANITLRAGGMEYTGSERKGEEWTTAANGMFRIQLPETADLSAGAELSVTKSGYAPLAMPLTTAALSAAQPFAGTFTMHRTTGPAFYIAAVILALVYLLIALEWVHRTLAALAGAVAMLMVSYLIGTFHPAFFIMSFEEAMHAVDFNVVFLLLGMMIIVGVMRETGVFEWLAYWSFRLSKGNVFRLAAILIVVTAVVSAFLDNVTTMLLLAPITIDIAVVLGISPVALLMPEILASNVGGTATLIGDPPNIMIGSYAGLTFTDFLFSLAPLIAIITAALIGQMLFVYRREYTAARVADFKAMEARLEKECAIRDRQLLFISLLTLAGVVLLFLFHGVLHMAPSVAALAGAALLLFAAHENIVKFLERDVEWGTLVFFIMLFIVIGGCERAGLIQYIADWVLKLSGGSPLTAVMLVLVVSAFTSAVIDNIPYTATMLPVVAYLTENITGLQGTHTLWWALSLGACLGGNATIVGASANVVTTGLAEKAGYPVGFMYFLRVGGPAMLVSIAISAVWLFFTVR